MKCWEAFLEIHHTKVGCPYMGFFEGLCVKMTPRSPALLIQISLLWEDSGRSGLNKILGGLLGLIQALCLP